MDELEPVAVQPTSNGYAPSDPIVLTASIVASHVANNKVETAALPDLVRTVHQALTTVQASAGAEKPAKRPEPAVDPKKSVFRDYIICLEDGKRLQMLKRHLRTSYGLTPEQYRERWGLSYDYPMTAPGYTERRSALAREIGLGKQSGRRRSS